MSISLIYIYVYISAMNTGKIVSSRTEPSVMPWPRKVPE